jgi:hypothetical protein
VPASSGSSSIVKSVDAAKRGAGLPASRSASWRQASARGGSQSVAVKDLERRGFVRRRRDARDERRLAIVLTAEGRRRAALLDGFEALAEAAELTS